MTFKPRHRRLAFIILLLAVFGAAVGLVLDALNKNIDFFVSPSTLIQKNPTETTWLRLGGIVKPGSVYYTADRKAVSFVITDYVHEIPVRFEGLLPDLFSPGRDIVANGHWVAHTFIASEVLAKHDNNYMPAEVKKLIIDAKKQRSQTQKQTQTKSQLQNQSQTQIQKSPNYTQERDKL